MAIEKVKVGVTRLIAGPTKVLKKYENITLNIEVEANIQPGDDPDKTYKDALWFCQKRLIKEMERMELGLPPDGYAEEFGDDEIPEFPIQNKTV